ncbi:MAG TPA: hypothetical protein VFO01_18530 [Trebonia sp.]|nr:hypothetical protein [Trebonia sp.]
MPSSWHDSVTAIFTQNPGLAVELAGRLTGTPLPAGTPAHVEKPAFSDRPSTDFAADAVIVAGPKHDPVRGIIVEAQKRTFKDKPPQWARYAAQLWTVLRCPVDVLVICPDAKSAFYYAQPVPTSLPGYTHVPVALLPSDVPAITDPDDAVANPAMAALSVAYHGAEPGVPEAVSDGLDKLPSDQSIQYREYAYNLAPLAVQRILEQLMNSDTWPVYSPFAKEHFGRGRKEGRTEGRKEGKTESKAEVLDFLEARGFDVSDAERERITSCTDLRRLRKWVKRAATAEKTSDLFAGESPH